MLDTDKDREKIAAFAAYFAERGLWLRRVWVEDWVIKFEFDDDGTHKPPDEVVL